MVAPGRTTGLAAYDAWVAAMESGDFIPFGAAYNAQCWAESRALGRDFLGRAAGRCPFASAPLGRAAEAFGESADRLAQGAETRAREVLREALDADWPLG